MTNWQEKFLETVKNYKNIVFSTSFGTEDQVILDFIAKENLGIEIFTIDTGRLHQETYELWQGNLDKYHLKIKAFYPNQEEISDFVEKNGINAFYDSVELRKKCCEIRKVNPLKIALKGKDLWISGIRKEQSFDRSKKEILEKDAIFGLDKFYPLFELSQDDILQIIDQENIALNPLYDKGFKSIGCSPCTRATFDLVDQRSGRWWWENVTGDKKECGLHSVGK